MISKDELELLYCVVSDKSKHIVQEPKQLSCGHLVCKECCIDRNVPFTLECMKCGVSNEIKTLDGYDSYIAEALIRREINSIAKIIIESHNESINIKKNKVNDLLKEVDLKISYIKEELDIRIESLKTELDQFALNFHKRVDRLRDKIYCNLQNSVIYCDFFIKNKEQNINEVLFYDFQEKLKIIDKELEKSKSYNIQINFDPSKVEISECSNLLTCSFEGGLEYSDLSLCLAKKLECFENNNSIKQVNGKTILNLLDVLKEKNIKNERVYEVMSVVDRANYTSENPYDNSLVPLPNGYEISQPYVDAHCLELLEDCLGRGAQVLEIGSGSGYLTSCFGLLCGKEGKVIAIDCCKEMIDLAKENINKDKFITSNSNIEFFCGNGLARIWENQSFNVIFIGGKINEIPNILFDQLKSGGRILAPIENKFVMIYKDHDKNIHKKELKNEVFFEPLMTEF